MKKREFVKLLFASIITIFVSAFTMFSVKNKAVIKVKGKAIGEVKPMTAWEKTVMSGREWNQKEKTAFENVLKMWDGSENYIEKFRLRLPSTDDRRVRALKSKSESMYWLAGIFSLLVEEDIVKGLYISPSTVRMAGGKEFKILYLVIDKKYERYDNKDLNNLVDEIKIKRGHSVLTRSINNRENILDNMKTEARF